MKLHICSNEKDGCWRLFAAEESLEEIPPCEWRANREQCELDKITTITDKDGKKYRVMLVPDLSEEAST